MSSSLLGTFQTDWITGRSLETVVFCLATIGEAFAAASGLRDSPETGSDDSKNEREWRTNARRPDKRIQHLHNHRHWLRSRWFYSLHHLNLLVETVALLAPIQVCMNERGRECIDASRISTTWNFERNSLYITNGIGILLQHLWLNTSEWLRAREKFNRYTQQAANWGT